MTSPPVPECPEIQALVTTDLAVHLILRMDHDWDKDREAAVAEVEHKTQAATAFAASPAFKARFGARIGVLRVQSPTVAPSIVSHLLTEQGIELEHLGAPRPEPSDSPTCSFCGRDHLSVDQAAMTDSGWACPACFRAWTIKTQPQLLHKERRLRIPPRLVLPLILLVAVLFAGWAAYELRRLSAMNTNIRLHLPRE
jgi:hypothetical protein